jgi:Protein of unknown function (DUF2599)
MTLTRLVGAVLSVAAVLLVGCAHPTGVQTRPAQSTVTVTVTPKPTPKSTSAPAHPPAVSSSAAPVPLIDHVSWTTTDQGRQLQVYPTSKGRTDRDSSAQAHAWAQVLADAPNANTPGMYDQFRCHWEFARIVEPNKPSWNLEPWRPAVGYSRTVAAQCNPGGPES